MGIGFVVYDGDFKDVLDVAKGSCSFAELDDGFCLIVVEVGMAFELVECNAVEVEGCDVVGIGIEVWSDVVVADRVHAFHFPELAFIDIAAEEVAVADDAAGKSGTDVVELHQVDGVGSVEIEKKLLVFARGCSGR